MTPQEKIARYVYENRRRDLTEVLEVAAKRKKMTPIEAIFYSAFWTIAQEENQLGLVSGEHPGAGELSIVAQAPIERYRADFIVSVIDDDKKLHSMVVECDGHDFHERTKEQARHDRARDRRLQELGFIVFRFTGSEIYSDPVKCALSVYEWAVSKAWGRVE